MKLKEIYKSKEFLLNPFQRSHYNFMMRYFNSNEKNNQNNMKSSQISRF